jgi:Ca2+-binding EF-hand superfamily protein
MRWKLLVAPVFLTGLLFLATVDSQGQPPGGGDGFRGKGKGGKGGFPGGGFGAMQAPDPDMMWGFIARGQDSINLNDPQFARMRQRMEQTGQAIPPNGILTKEQFKANFQQQMAQGGGMTMRFGGGQPGGTPGAMTFQATPGADGKPTVVLQGGGPGGFGGTPGMGGMSGNSDEAMMNFFRRADRNGDGRITPDEANGPLRDRFQEFDTNHDGAIDFNEYKPYIMQRMAMRGDGGGRGDRGPGGFGGGPGGFDMRNGAMATSAFPNGGPGGWGGSPGGWGNGGGGWGGGPPPGGWNGGDQGSQSDRRGRNHDDEDDKPVVYRYGKMPKGIPNWFETYDDDQDGQIGLYEWRRHGEATAKFVEMDLNGDGYLTPDEWLRYQQIQLEKKSDSSASSEGDDRPRGPRANGPGDRGPRGQGGDRNPGAGDKGGRPGRGGPPGGGRGQGGDRGNQSEGKKNPFTGG